MHPEIVNEAQATLGGGPAWDAKSGARCSFDGSQVTRLLNGIRISNGLATCGSRWGAARLRLDHADLTAYRHSGSLMRVQTKVEGMPSFEFG